MGCLINHRYMGGSVALNGTTSTIPTTLTSNDVFLTGNGFTMWRWIFVKSFGEGGGQARLFDKSTGTSGQDGFDYTMYLTAGNVFFRVNNGSGKQSGVNSIQTNRWTLALVTVAPDATVTHYINNSASGTPATTGALSGITTANPLTIGNRSTATDRTFDGLLGEGGICPRVLTQAEITALFTGEQPIPDDTAHHWALDEVTGVFADTVGGATGTGTATTYSTDTPVQMRTAIDWEARSSLSFDGNDYVTLATPITAGSLSFETSAKSIASNNYFFDSVGNKTIQLSPTGLWDVYDTADRVSTIAARLNTWDKMAFVYRDGGYDIYRNGQLANRIATCQQISITTIARNISGINGLLKNVRMWSQATQLTRAKIIDLHFNNIVPTTGLVLDLPMNEGAGSIAYDHSGNDNHGTLSSPSTMWSAELPNAPRALIGANMVKNGDFSYVPVVNVPQTTSGTWMDGTAGGSSSNKLFRWVPKTLSGAQTFGAIFEEGGVSLNVTANTGNIHLANTVVTGSWGIASAIDGVPVQKNTQYTLRFKVKTIGITNTASKGFQATVSTGYASWSGFSDTSSFIRGTNDWQEVSLTFTTHATASPQWLQTAFRMETETGKFIVKDISLLPTTPVVNIPLSAPAVAITCP